MKKMGSLADGVWDFHLSLIKVSDEIARES